MLASAIGFLLGTPRVRLPINLPRTSKYRTKALHALLLTSLGTLTIQHPASHTLSDRIFAAAAVFVRCQEQGCHFMRSVYYRPSRINLQYHSKGMPEEDIFFAKISL